jgi:hypothetical protein
LNEKNDCVLKNTKKIRLGIKPHIRPNLLRAYIDQQIRPAFVCKNNYKWHFPNNVRETKPQII